MLQRTARAKLPNTRPMMLAITLIRVTDEQSPCHVSGAGMARA